jgi:hypothetical protein
VISSSGSHTKFLTPPLDDFNREALVIEIDTNLPARDGALAPGLSSDNYPQDVLAERQVRHEPLQARVLIAQLPHRAQRREAQPRVPLPPQIEARLAHAELAADLRYRYATFAWRRA